MFQDKKKPLITALMTVYNGERFLCEAIDSILAQTFTDFELLVVDDCSTDSTPDLLASYSDPRLVILRNEQNSGPTRSANVGLAVARGEFVARHDADDASEPTRFMEQISIMQQNPSLGMLQTSYRIIDHNGQILETVLLPTSNNELQKRLEVNNTFCHGAAMFRKDSLDKIGGYREYFRLTLDYDIFLRLSEQYEIACLPKPLYRFRINPTSLSRTKRPLQLAYRRLARELALQRRYQGQESPLPHDVLAAFPPEPEKLFDDARGTSYLYYVSGAYDVAAESLRRAEAILATEMEPQVVAAAPDWQTWALNRALTLSQLRGDVEQGARFVRWLFTNLTLVNRDELARRVTGKLYADQAFKAFYNGHKRKVLPYMSKAIRSDTAWLRNRGLWSISIQSLLSRR